MSKPAKRRRSWFEIGFWSLLTMLFLLFDGHLIWLLAAEHLLKKDLDRLHAAGEPVTWSDLQSGDIPPDQDASLLYEAIGKQLNPELPLWKDLDDGDELRLPLTDKETSDIHSIVAAYSNQLLAVGPLRTLRVGAWGLNNPHPTILWLLPHLNHERSLARLLKLGALDAHMHGDDALAVERLMDCLALGNALENSGGLIGHLVAIGVQNMASATIASTAPELNAGKNQLDRRQLLLLLHALEDETSQNQGILLAYRGERIVLLNTMQDMATGKLTLNVVGAQPGTIMGSMQSYLTRPLIVSDERLTLKYFQALEPVESAPDFPASKQLEPRWFDQLLTNHRLMHITASMLVASYSSANEHFFRDKADRRLAAVAVAARLYAADHQGQLPDSLSAMVPAYLPAVPSDPMSGKAMSFKSDPPRVYCYGTDAMDHGGAPADPKIPLYKHPVGDIVVYLTSQARPPNR